MTPTRQEFLRTVAAATLAAALAPADATVAGERAQASAGYEPWIEVDAEALRHNAREVARACGGRPILAVVKNNAYGLGIAHVGPVLDAAPEVATLAVVKPEEALALRDAGVRKPILLMALAETDAGIELARRDVRLAAFTDDVRERVAAIARALGRRAAVHAYIDSGMGRMGIRHDRALPWLEALARSGHALIEGSFTELAESDADEAQLARFDEFLTAARGRGIDPGTRHALSSHAICFRPAATLDAVRPGLVLYGAYPAGARTLGKLNLRVAFRLRARVVRVEQIQPGDGVSYGRNYVAAEPTWIATLPLGHADGYTRQAVRGAQVLIGNRLYPVIGAVSASHTIIAVGREQTVHVGDTATIVGPDDPAIAPNEIAERAGISVYDVLMHLSRTLQRQRV